RMSAFNALDNEPLVLGLVTTLGVFLVLAVLAAIPSRIRGRRRLFLLRDEAGSYALLFLLALGVVIGVAFAARWVASSHVEFASAVFVAWLAGVLVASFVPLNTLV